MQGVRIAICSIACVLAPACSKSAQDSPTAAAEPPKSVAATDPRYDWEKPDRLDMGRSNAIPVDIQSARTLDETNRWLEWTIKRYGHARPTIYDLDVNKVALRRCSFELTVTEKPSYGVTKVSTYSVPLGDVDLTPARARYSSDGVRLYFTREMVVQRRYIENGEEKARSPEKEWYVDVPIRDQEQLPARVGLALVHASSLCGAKPQP
jgi:hypothetical protein